MKNANKHSAIKKSVMPVEELVNWPNLELTIEELDEPVFQPQQVVPRATPLTEVISRKDKGSMTSKAT